MTPHLSFDVTTERIAELQAVAAASHRKPQPSGDGRLSAVDRVRDAVGLRLIQLGAAVVSDGGRPRRLARP